MSFKESEFKREATLNRYLQRHPERIEEGMEIVESELRTGKVGRIDLLGCDSDGAPTVIELKVEKE